LGLIFLSLGDKVFVEETTAFIYFISISIKLLEEEVKKMEVLKVNLTSEQVSFLQGMLSVDIEETAGTRYGEIIANVYEKIKTIDQGGVIEVTNNEAAALKLLLQDIISVELETIRECESIVEKIDKAATVPIQIPQWMHADLQYSYRKVKEEEDVVVKLPRELLYRMDILIERGEFKSREDFIRKAVEELLKLYKNMM